MPKVCNAWTVYLTHKVTAKEYFYCQWNLANLCSAFICYYLPFVFFTGYRISDLSLLWRCPLSFWVSSRASVLCDDCPLVKFMRSFTEVKEVPVIFTSQCSCNIKIFGLSLKAAMQWTPAVWYRVPVFTQEMKINFRVLWWDRFYILFVSTRSSNGLIHLLLFGENGNISFYSFFAIIAVLWRWCHLRSLFFLPTDKYITLLHVN